MNRRFLQPFTSVSAVVVAVLFFSVGCRQNSGSECEPEVRNIILLVGDGMGLAQISSLVLADEKTPIEMERATVGGFVKTASANNRVTDSAASATAYATGEKTNNGYLGVDANGAPLETILEKAEKAGMATGLVATIHITHATPAAFYAHITDRNDYDNIALALPGAGIDVTIDENSPILGDAGESPDPMRLAKKASEALDVLTANGAASGKGFFAMIEGSFIDSSGHGNDPEMLLYEMRDFDNAVGVAFDYADAHPGTLVIVLADHETGGLTLPAGKENFLLPDSGVEFAWSTGGHTGTMIPILAYGAGASKFGGIMDNTEVNHRMEELLGLE